MIFDIDFFWQIKYSPEIFLHTYFMMPQFHTHRRCYHLPRFFPAVSLPPLFLLLLQSVIYTAIARHAIYGLFSRIDIFFFISYILIHIRLHCYLYISYEYIEVCFVFLHIFSFWAFTSSFRYIYYIYTVTYITALNFPLYLQLLLFSLSYT